MKVKKIYQFLNDKYPFYEQEVWDNSGLNLGSFKKEVKAVLLTLDITLKVIAEAIEKNCDLIISHHPLLISEIKEVNLDKLIGKKLELLIKNDISVLSLHTNYDLSSEGMNYQLAKKMKLDKIEVAKSNPLMYKGYFKGDLDTFIAKIKDTFKLDFVRYTGEDLADFKVGVIGGSGASEKILNDYKKEKLDLFITGDIKSHFAKDATELNFNILDVSHNIENIFTEMIENDFLKLELKVIKSRINTEPFKLK